MWRTLVAAASIGLASCGSDGEIGGSSCAEFAACGGDVTGTWKFSSLCGAPRNPVASCPAATFTTGGEVEGSVTYNANGTYGGGYTVRMVADMSVPASCLGSTTCSSLEAELKAKVVGTAICASSTSACNCHVDYAPSSNVGSGTWTVSGTSLTTTGSAGSTFTRPFCVQGDTFMQARTSGDVPLTLVATRS